MIMIPLLILQIFLFPLTANWLMNIWVDSRRTLTLQDAASHLGSTIQQLYFSLDHPSVPDGTEMSSSPRLPPFIDGFHYLGNATLRSVGPAPTSSQLLEITLRLIATGIKVTTSVILGSDAQWNQASVFMSNSSNPCICADKDVKITLYFQG